MTAPRSPECVVGSALFGLGAPFKKKDAQYLLDALKAAGYRVVELPKWTQHVQPSDQHNEDGRYEWNTGDDLVSAYASPPEVFLDSREMSPNKARGLAVALLAAADVAESADG